MNWKRIIVAVVLGAIFGAFCAYGTSELDPEVVGFEIDSALLLTTFYNRVLIGLLVGVGGGVALLKDVMNNAALRGAVFGALISIGIGFYGGMEVLVAFGAVYGLITDVVSTKVAGE